MRKTLQIFSASFILIFGYLQVQPLYIDYAAMMEKCKAPKKAECSTKSEEPVCAKMKKPLCSKSKCMLPVSSEEEEDCNSNGCNPFVPCNIGFCCYIVEGFYAYNYSFLTNKASLIAVNDNRLSSALSECFHPPELIS